MFPGGTDGVPHLRRVNQGGVCVSCGTDEGVSPKRERLSAAEQDEVAKGPSRGTRGVETIQQSGLNVAFTAGDFTQANGRKKGQTMIRFMDEGKRERAVSVVANNNEDYAGK